MLQKRSLLTNNGYITCSNCGQVIGYDVKYEYINFYENLFKMHKKSIDHRKYHIENILNQMKVQTNYNHRKAIYKIFKLIDKVKHKVNYDRKRLINIKFILKEIFILLELPVNEIQIINYTKTLDFYKEWWGLVNKLIKDDLVKID